MWNYDEDSGPRTVGVTTSEKPIKKGRCCHHWIIETPDGPMCKGVCKFCVFSVLASMGEQDDS